jgi:tetratricopeptide (TPR) repeat protein
MSTGDESANFKPKQFSKTDDQEDEGNLIIQNLVRKNKKVKIRLGGNDKTPGRDGFLELRDTDTVLGKLEIQAKPVDSEEKKEGRGLRYKLPATLIAYSERAGLPVILICYDRDTDKAYWKHINRSLFEGTKSDQKTKLIDFAADDEIADARPYTEAWFGLLEKHLQSLKLAEMMRPALKQLADEKGIAGLLESPEAMAELLKHIYDTAAEKYKTRLKEAQKLFNDSEIEAATKILAPLSEELRQGKESKETLFDVLIWLGNCRYRLEQFEEAEKCFREALEIDQKSARAQSNLAHILYVRNTKKKEALDFAKAAFVARPEHAETLGTYLLCLSFNKETKELEQIVELNKAVIENSSVLQVVLAQVARERMDYKGACKPLLKAMELDPNNHHAKILYGETVYKLVRTDATDLISRGIVPDPEQAETQLADAVSKIDDAIGFLTKRGDRAALYHAYDCRAVINMIRNRFDDTLADCNKMESVIPEREFAKIVRAQVFSQQNRFIEVIKVLEPLADSGRHDVLQLLAYSHYRLNQYKEAAGFYDKYIDEDSASIPELCSYVQCLWFSGNTKHAYQLAYKLRKAGKAPIEIMREVELKRMIELRDHKACLEIIEDLLKAEPRNPDTWIQRIAMHMELRNREQAMRFYGELPRNLIQDDWARQYLSNIEQGLRQLGWLR